MSYFSQYVHSPGSSFFKSMLAASFTDSGKIPYSSSTCVTCFSIFSAAVPFLQPIPKTTALGIKYNTCVPLPAGASFLQIPMWIFKALESHLSDSCMNFNSFGICPMTEHSGSISAKTCLPAKISADTSFASFISSIYNLFFFANISTAHF